MNDKNATGAKPLVVYLIAGEASGDLIGAHLMKELKEQSARKVEFYGVGGPKMIAQGLNSLFPFYELSMLGAVEILPYLFNISVRIRQCVDDILAKAPDVVVTIDSPGFTFRVVERLRKERAVKSRFVHYVAPTVWVYKPERAALCAKLFDHMLVLLPFEPPYFEEAGLACTWVGHPAIAESYVGNGAEFRKKFEIADDVPVFCLMPGSRKGEIERHMPILGKTVTLLARQHPAMALAVAVPPNAMPFIAPYFENCPYRAVVMSDEQDKKNAIAASQLAIVKSGTVALEVAMAHIPMVITYKVHPLSAWYLRRRTNIKTVNLVNILEKQEVIPELLQELCTPLMIASACDHLLLHPQRQEAQKAAQKHALDRLHPLDGERPSHKAARIILAMV